MARATRSSVLAKAVASAFQSAGFAPADLLKGQITITDMPWQAPPLRSTAPLGGLPFSAYLDSPIPVNTAKVYEFYGQTLALLRHAPDEVADETGYKVLSRVLPHAGSGDRRLALPLPEGWPAGESFMGPMFALEVAHLLRTSASGLLDFVEDADNYYVEIAQGKVGIVAGYVSMCADDWDISSAGMVPALLEMPRGQVTTTCLYDTIARLRSALYEAPEKFQEFEGVDLGLQTLRILSDGQICRDLQQAIEQMSLVAFKRRLKVETYRKAIEIMEDWHLTDRVKISMLQELLIPSYMHLELFSRKILDPRRIMPSVLSTKTEQRVLKVLRHEMEKASYADKALKPA
jgi:hypothetical protein